MTSWILSNKSSLIKSFWEEVTFKNC